MRFLMILVLLASVMAIAQDEPVTVNKERLQTAVTWLRLIKVDVPDLPMNDASGFAELCSTLERWASKRPPSCLSNGSAGEPGSDVTKSAEERQNEKDAKKAFLKTSFQDRLARVPQFKAEWLRTANYVYGLPEGAPKSATPSILPDPDHGLLSLGGELDFSELFPSVQSRLDYCTALINLDRAPGKSMTEDPDPAEPPKPLRSHLPPGCLDWNYLAVKGFKRLPERYAIGTVINVNVSEIPGFQSGILVPSPGWTETVTGSIIPATWFVSLAERKALVAYYSANSKMKFNTPYMSGFCEPRTSPGNCLQYLAIGRKSVRWAVALLPRIDVKAYSPFDLAKTSSNTFLSLPGGDKPLYDFNATWNLRSTVASAQMKTDALTAFGKLPACSAPRNKKEPGGSADNCAKLQKTSAADELSNIKGTLADKFAQLAKKDELASSDAWWSAFRDDIATYSLASQGGAQTQ